jgi:hypothetical protein
MDFPQELCDRILYRGQSDSEWGLAPSALRDFEKTGRIQDILNYQNQIRENFQSLKDFIVELTYLPKSSDEIITLNINEYFSKEDCEIIVRSSKELAQWPMDPYDKLSAIAQHRGTSTCLLDWSRYSYIAAFFASIGHIHNEQKFDKVAEIAIWVYVPIRGINNRIKIIDLFSREENLKAQKGSFIKIIQDISKRKKEMFFDTIETVCKEDELYKVTLSKNFSKEILQYLEKYNINYAILHPADGNGATMNIKIRRLCKTSSADRKTDTLVLDMNKDVEKEK